jgi:hypothetical protein
MTNLISRKQINTRIRRRLCVPVLLGVLAIGHAHAQTAPDGQAPSESLDEAWWTGPMLANSAKTLPAGHALIESYLYDDIEKYLNSYRSLSYLLYGLTDRVTVGLIPTGGVNQINGARSGTGIGDTTLQAQYALTSFDARSGIPDISLAFRESLPTGKYDHLDQNSDAFGSGAYTTSVAIFTQDYFWLPNGRLLRGRLDLFESFSSDASTGPPRAFSGTPDRAMPSLPMPPWNTASRRTGSWRWTLFTITATASRFEDRSMVERTISNWARATPSAMRRPLNIIGRRISACCWALASSPRGATFPAPSHPRSQSTMSFEEREFERKK